MNESPATGSPDSITHSPRRYFGIARAIGEQTFIEFIASAILPSVLSAITIIGGSFLGLGVLNEINDLILPSLLGGGYIIFMTALIILVWHLQGVKSWIGILALVGLSVVTFLIFNWGYSRIEWPPTAAKYYSFEKDEDLEGWSNGSQRTEEQFYSGKHSLKANFRMPLQEDSAMDAELRWDKVFIADVIVGSMYFPASQDYLIENISVCLETEQHGSYCERVSTQINQWNTFVLILSDMNLEGSEVYLDDVVIEHLYFQMGIRSVNGTRVAEVPFYLDNLQIYRDGSS